MSIQRDEEGIQWHNLGTLHSVTQWIPGHPEGLAEWLKNVRRAFQPDRANVAPAQRAAVLLMRDESHGEPAMLGMLDVGGATLEDVTKWSHWQNPQASSRGSPVQEEQTQGNGAKAYMYRKFTGRARILGVKDGKLNCKGFEGEPQSLERGTPGFIPDAAAGRDLPVESWRLLLQDALEPYNLKVNELPPQVVGAITERQAFTLVEGLAPKDLYQGRIPTDLVAKLLRHEQAAAALEQFKLYAIHNGRVLNDGKPLQLEPIAPYPGFEQPRVYPLPSVLKDDAGNDQSTLGDGSRQAGRLVLYTSQDDMPRNYKTLKPRWKMTYRANPNHIIGSKPISDFAATVPSSCYIYGTVELGAFEPDYVSLGRIRPNDGPLMSAVDRFIVECIKGLAKEISDRRRLDLDEKTLEEVQRENRLLDKFKNQFLSTSGPSGLGDNETGEGGRKKRKRKLREHEYGDTPHSIELDWDETQTLRTARGVSARMEMILCPRVVDAEDRLVPRSEVEWVTDDRHVAAFRNDDELVATGKGRTRIWCKMRGSKIESARIEVEVWQADHILLTPRSLEIPLGKWREITAQVTNDEGERATDVLLNWSHDAPDPLIVRVSPWGRVTGNRVGRTAVTAGAGDSTAGGVWARIPAEIAVMPALIEPGQGGGFPKLLVTGEPDPSTGEIREANREQPALWQEVTDFLNNIWWLNLGSPEAEFFFDQRIDNPTQWRAFHAQKVIEMVVQIHMKEEYTTKGENERPDVWAGHKGQLEIYQVLLMQSMWTKVQPYVSSGIGLE